MRRILGVVTAAVALLAGGNGAAEAARFTSHLDPLEAALAARAADPGLPKKQAKLYGKGLKTLAKDTTSLFGDVQAAAKVIPPLEKKAASDPSVLAAATSAVDGLVGAVEAAFAEAQAEADALRTGKSPLVKIDKRLGSVGRFLLRARGGGSLGTILKSLVPATKGLTQTQALLAKAGGTDPDPDPDPDPADCGPTSDPWLAKFVRNLKSGETATADVPNLTMAGTHTFTAGALVALAGPQNGFPGAAQVLDLQFFDCTTKEGIGVTLPFPPAAGTTYTEMTGGGGAYQVDYDGMVLIFPRGNSVTVDAFDAASQAVTGTAAFGGITIDFSVRGFDTPTTPRLPPGPPAPPAKPER